MKAFFHDTPIDGSIDLPDDLNRTCFAQNISRSLLLDANSPSVVVSIEDDWGMGKTSLLNLIDAEIRKLPTQPISFFFNPWIVSSYENLVQNYLMQFASHLALDNSGKFYSLAKKIKAYADIFSFLKNTPYVGPVATFIFSVIDGLNNGALGLEKLRNTNIDKKRGRNN